MWRAATGGGEADAAAERVSEELRLGVDRRSAVAAASPPRAVELCGLPSSSCFVHGLHLRSAVHAWRRASAARCGGALSPQRAQSICLRAPSHGLPRNTASSQAGSQDDNERLPPEPATTTHAQAATATTLPPPQQQPQVTEVRAQPPRCLPVCSARLCSPCASPSPRCSRSPALCLRALCVLRSLPLCLCLSLCSCADDAARLVASAASSAATRIAGQVPSAGAWHQRRRSFRVSTLTQLAAIGLGHAPTRSTTTTTARADRPPACGQCFQLLLL